MRKQKTMKKILLSVLALLAIVGRGSAQNLPSYVPANGLVGWWPFNGNANDESGNGYNGIANNALLTADLLGNPIAAYALSGSSQYIDFPRIRKIPTQGSITYSLWVKPTGGEGWIIDRNETFGLVNIPDLDMDLQQ